MTRTRIATSEIDRYYNLLQLTPFLPISPKNTAIIRPTHQAKRQPDSNYSPRENLTDQVHGILQTPRPHRPPCPMLIPALLPRPIDQTQTIISIVTLRSLWMQET